MTRRVDVRQFQPALHLGVKCIEHGAEFFDRFIYLAHFPQYSRLPSPRGLFEGSVREHTSRGDTYGVGSIIVEQRVVVLQRDLRRLFDFYHDSLKDVDTWRIREFGGKGTQSFLV